jgi:hypothetical protein
MRMSQSVNRKDGGLVRSETRLREDPLRTLRRVHRPNRGVLRLFFSDPRSDDLQVYFAHVYLRKKKLACEESERGRGDEDERDKYLCVILGRKYKSFEEL